MEADFVQECVLSCFSHVQFFATLWTISARLHGAWDSLGKNTSPGNPPNPGIKPGSLMSPALAGRFFTTSATGLRELDVNDLC